MNCQDFETIVNDLARDQIMEATLREQSVVHSTSCSACSVRLRDEQTLTHGLRELALLMQAETTPEAIEGRLLAKFRSRRTEQRASNPNGFLPIASGGGKSRRSYWAYAAVAAALVIALGVTAVRIRDSSAVSGRVESSGETSSPENVAKHTDSVAPFSAPVRGSVENQENPVERTARRNAPRSVRPDASSKLRVAKNTVTVQSLEILSADTEVTTDFIPIALGNASNVQEGGQVVRLELPRYAMARFGVLVNEERYDERVKADVWVGADGFARAIRFVQ